MMYVSDAAAQVNEELDELVRVKNILIENHVAPKTIDDSLSSRVFDEIIDRLDEHRIIFTLEDIKKLGPYRLKLDDEMKGGKWLFLPLLEETYRMAMAGAHNYYTSVGFESIKWNSPERYSIVSDEFVPKAQISQRRQLYLKYLVLEKTLRRADGESKLSLYFQAVQSRLVNRFKLKPDQYKVMLRERYYDALARAFDPHSSYFSMEAYRLFNEQLSARAMRFGFHLGENARGEVIIQSLTPGAPAWNSGSLNVDDVLLSLQAGSESPMDVGLSDVEEVSEYMEKYDLPSLTMKVRKSNGLEVVVQLQKAEVVNEDNIVQSFVIEGAQRMGYIYLPSFYSDFDNDNDDGGKCANDVAREIIRLKREKITGLILDLRFNGGGSLGEALAMAGIFIDEGILAVSRDAAGNRTLLRDLYRGTVYDGPLAVLVNGASASASEIFASTIQDYNRGVVVGSTTYGKATAQYFQPSNDIKPSGLVKVTREMIFRVDGRTHQGVGVIPDIELPSFETALIDGESDEWGYIRVDAGMQPVNYQKLKNLPLETLRERSQGRQKLNSHFVNAADAGNKLARAIEKDTVVTLSIDAAREDIRSLEKLIADLHLNSDTKLSNVRNISSIQAILERDPALKIQNGHWLEKVSNDVYIYEACQILADLIELSKRP